MVPGTTMPDTGLPDHVDNLTVLLQQAAEDVRRYDAFALDASNAGDAEFAEWCEELAASDRSIVQRAAQMLTARLALVVGDSESAPAGGT